MILKQRTFEGPTLGQWELVYENRHQQIYRVTADFDQFTKEYFVLDTGQRAAIVVARGASVLLVRQYRLLINGLAWEIPGGKVDDGETPAEAAVRECLEETGVRCHNPRPLIFFHVGLDTARNPTHIFYSDEVADEIEPQRIHVEEVDSYEWVPLADCIKMIFERQIVDCLSIVALLACQTLIGERSP
jgi:8-oxo-dGTP pyrophosphatase MutT (NUDIX family)